MDSVAEMLHHTAAVLPSKKACGLLTAIVPPKQCNWQPDNKDRTNKFGNYYEESKEDGRVDIDVSMAKQSTQ